MLAPTALYGQAAASYVPLDLGGVMQERMAFRDLCSAEADLSDAGVDLREQMLVEHCEETGAVILSSSHGCTRPRHQRPHVALKRVSRREMGNLDNFGLEACSAVRRPRFQAAPAVPPILVPDVHGAVDAIL